MKISQMNQNFKLQLYGPPDADEVSKGGEVFQNHHNQIYSSVIYIYYEYFPLIMTSKYIYHVSMVILNAKH